MEAALAARQPVEFDRARETPRRRSAVELLLSLGYVWATDHWEARQPAGAEPVAWQWKLRTDENDEWVTRHKPLPASIINDPTCEHRALYTAPPAPEMSPDFTDTARAAIAWVLWHHQGGSSAIGQPLRYALGMGDHEALSAQQISEAKRYADLVGARTDHFKKPAPAAVPAEPKPLPYDTDALVQVPRSLIGAACYAITKNANAPATLSELRRYTTGDLSTAAQAGSAPAAVPVDGIREALSALADNWNDGVKQLLVKNPGDTFPECDAIEGCASDIRKLLATHPQPAAATGVPELFVQWLEREMPAGTIIGKPAWWAPKLARALRSAERGVLGGCNG
ncbi:hypothetical protein XspCFBP7912_13125 [Xanthomonas sp. CFBP 7912]|nr:hypothetical protein XspCFBP7912_13125 [Xanthomonas sp. CFBP 7912]